MVLLVGGESVSRRGMNLVGIQRTGMISADWGDLQSLFYFTACYLQGGNRASNKTVSIKVKTKSFAFRKY